MIVPPPPSAAPAFLDRLASQLYGRLRDLGMSLRAWDAVGRPLGDLQTRHPLCAVLGCPGGVGQPAHAEAACRALAAREPQVSDGPCGGCLLTVPVIRRRRTLGALTVCFPVREALDDGTLGEQARRAGAPAGEWERAARAVRHSRHVAHDYLKLLSWLVESQQEADLARGETESLSVNLANTYEELSLLYLISGSMKVNQSPEEFFQTVCQNLLEVMHLSGAAAIVEADPSHGEGGLLVRAGADCPKADDLRLLAERHASRLAHHRAFVHNALSSSAEAVAGVERVLFAPMVVEDRPLGLLLAVNKLTGEFDSVDLKLLSSIASQAAVFVSNSRLYAEVRDLLMGVLHALTASIDAKDPYTSGHSARVAIISRRLAEKIGLPEAKVQRIYLAGLLHDIGKIGVPESVLRKPGRLSDEEFREIQTHPGIGARILGGIRQLDDVMGGIYCHHERPDGKGYPQGLRGEQVPRDGLIVGLSDSFDAMTTDRVYRKALALPVVVEELRRQSGLQFAPDLVEAFLSLDLAQLLEELREPASTVFPAPAEAIGDVKETPA